MLLLSMKYVASDDYFLMSMAFTTMVAMFIGSIIYNGDIKEIKKGLIAIGSYAFLITSTTIARVYPVLPKITPENAHMPFAGIATLIYVTLFYLIGMQIGVLITKTAHAKGR